MLTLKWLLKYNVDIGVKDNNEYAPLIYGIYDIFLNYLIS